MSKTFSERLYRVGDSTEGAFLTVCPGAERPEAVLLFSDGVANSKYFGQIRIEMSSEFMRALGKALLDCADDVDRPF